MSATGPVVEYEGDLARMTCVCGARAACRNTDPAMLTAWAQWWTREHSFCAVSARPMQQQARRMVSKLNRANYERRHEQARSYRCGRCDGVGHNSRTCPLPVDPSEVSQ